MTSRDRSRYRWDISYIKSGQNTVRYHGAVAERSFQQFMISDQSHDPSNVPSIKVRQQSLRAYHAIEMPTRGTEQVSEQQLY